MIFKIMIFLSLSVLEHTTQQHPYLKHCCSTQAHQVVLIQSFRQLLLHYTTKCINKAVYYMSVDINIWVLRLDDCLEAQSNKNYTFFSLTFESSSQQTIIAQNCPLNTVVLYNFTIKRVCFVILFMIKQKSIHT